MSVELILAFCICSFSFDQRFNLILYYFSVLLILSLVSVSSARIGNKKVMTTPSEDATMAPTNAVQKFCFNTQFGIDQVYVDTVPPFPEENCDGTGGSNSELNWLQSISLGACQEACHAMGKTVCAGIQYWHCEPEEGVVNNWCDFLSRNDIIANPSYSDLSANTQVSGRTYVAC